MIRLDWQGEDGYGYFYKEVAVSQGETSQPIWLEHDAQASVYLYPEGRAKVEFTGSPFDYVANGSARWQEWPLGTVSRSEHDHIVGVATAVRVVSINGAATVEVISK